MELLAASFSLSSLPSIIYTALGLGFVIFVHELGHFAVAKWCGVRVERFSIGFGPVILSFMKGETEYALSIIPFGGYVKMLGQDDIDPNQMASEQVARDPRSYTAKTVLQRMAIISAGVIMNLITGTMMFCAAFMMGLDSVPSTIGAVSPGSPAWVAGIQPGDNIDNIDGYRIVTFSDIMRRVTLSWEQVDLRGKHHDGTDYHEVIIPFKSKDDNRSTIGVTKANSLRLVDSTNELIQHVFAGTAAARAIPEFKPGDLVKKVNDKPVKDHFEFRQTLLEKPSEVVEVVVERAIGKEPGQTEEVKIKVAANPIRTLGLLMDIGQVAAIRKGSPAAGKLQRGDKITRLEMADGQEQMIGRDLDPLRLPQVLGDLHGQQVTLHIKRERPEADPESLKFTLVPENRPGWSEFPFDDDAAMSIPSIGITCFVLHSVISVDPKGPAADLVKPKDQIKQAELVLPPGVKSDSHGDKSFKLDFDQGKRSWPYLFWTMQECPLRQVKLTVASQGSSRTVLLVPAPVENWFTVERGIHFEYLVDFHRDTNLSVAMGRAVAETRNFMGEIYLILYNLATGRLSVTQMHGPIGIVNAAVQISDQGFAPLLFFLAYLSINLAVLNFLPIPVLDGGHMAFLLYEGIRGKPPSERILILLTWVGLALIGTLMVTVLGLDILRAFGFRK